MSLKIHDRPGRISVAEMRRDFELMIRGTPIQRNMPITALEISGQFSSYADEDTDAMWIGFALGRRCAESLTIQRNEKERLKTTSVCP